MPKDNKKNSKKGSKSNDLLDGAARSLKKFRRVTKHLTRLSTGQKLVGGVALLAAGLTYLAKSQAAAEAPAPLVPGGDESGPLGVASVGDAADKETGPLAGAAGNPKKPGKSRKK